MSQKVNVTQKHYQTYSKVRWAYSSGEGIINNFHNPSLLCHTKKLRFIQHCYLKSIYTWRDITSKAHYGKGKQEEEAQWSLKTHHSLSQFHYLALFLKLLCENLLIPIHYLYMKYYICWYDKCQPCHQMD